MAQLPDGKVRYVIASAIDFGQDGAYDFDAANVLGMSGGGTGNQTPLVASPPTGGNTQLWRQQVPSGQSYVYLRNCNGGKALELYRAQTADGTRPSQFTFNQSAAQRWWLEDTGETLTVNGTSYALYYVRAMSATGKLLTAYEDSYYAMIEPEGYPRGSAYDGYTPPIEQQMWLFVQSSLYFAGFPVPTAGGASATQSAGAASTVLQAASGSLWPSFKCEGTSYQCRYRTRSRGVSAAQDEFSDWSDWMAYDDGDTDNLGWGDSASTAANMATAKDGGRQLATSALAMTALGSSYDRIDYQLQVRRFEPNYSGEPRHGGTLDFTVSQVEPLTIDSLAATWSPDGVILSWQTNWPRGGCAVELRSGDGLWAGTFRGVPALGDDDIQVAHSKLTRRVEVGDVIAVTCTVTTPDGATATATRSVTVTYGGTVGTSLTLSASVSGHLATVTPSAASAKAWLVVPRGHGDRFVPLDGAAPWVVAPPLGVPWRVYATANVGGIWNATMQEFPAIVEVPAAHHVTTQDLAHDLAIVARKGGAPTLSFSHARDRQSVGVVGSEFPAATLGENVKSTAKLAGDLLAWEGGAALRDEYDAVAFAGRAILRSAWGDWHQVGVTGAEIDLSRADVVPVTINMQEESWR